MKNWPRLPSHSQFLLSHKDYLDYFSQILLSPFVGSPWPPHPLLGAPRASTRQGWKIRRKSGYNEIMEYPELGRTSRIIQSNSWPCTDTPKSHLGTFIWEIWFFMAIWFNICLFPTAQPPIFLAHFSPRAPFPLGFHSSKWTRDGLNNTEIFIFMQNPRRTLWCH